MAESNNLKKFAETVQDRDPRKSKKKVNHPKGFEPSASFNQATRSGEIVSQPQKSNDIDWKEQLESYFGKDAHAAGAPDQGINALDAQIQLFVNASTYRQQMVQSNRMHGVIILLMFIRQLLMRCRHKLLHCKQLDNIKLPLMY